MGWFGGLEEVGPAPDGGTLTAQVRCRTRRSGSGRVHEVVIGPDWSVSVPHDLAAERVAVAFGGYLSCVDLVDHTVPALRDLVQLCARRRLPPLVRTAAGRWAVDRPTHDCRCRSLTFATPREAAEHVRQPAHLASRYGASVRELGVLREAVERAHGGFAEVPPPGWHALALVSEPRGLDLLWSAGVPPELVQQVLDRVLPHGPWLSTSAYLGAAFHCPDLDWLAETVAADPEPDTAAWAAWAWSQADAEHPRLRAEWTRLGVPRSAVDQLVVGEIPVSAAEDLASLTGRTVRRAAQVLAVWERAGCRPGPGDVLALDALGVGDVYLPASAAVDAFLRLTGHLDPAPTRTQAAVLLGLAGTRAVALRLARAGLVTAQDAVAALDRPPWLPHASTTPVPDRTTTRTTASTPTPRETRP